jgi:hypothetical protein
MPLTLLPTLLLAPLAELHAGRTFREVPSVGELRVGFLNHWGITSR